MVWFEVELDALAQGSAPKAADVSRFPRVRRDLAVVVDETVDVQTLLNAMRQAAKPCVTEIALFDLYRGKGLEHGKKSLAFRVLLQDTQKTLTDSEIETSIKLLVAIMALHGAQLRI